MSLRTFLLENGTSIAIKVVDDQIVIFYDESKEVIVKDMKEVKSWIKKHYNQELSLC